jgi:hypothetical protein
MIDTSLSKEIDASLLLGSFGESWLLDMNLRLESMYKELCRVYCRLTHHSSRYSPQRFDRRKRQEGLRAPTKE